MGGGHAGYQRFMRRVPSFANRSTIPAEVANHRRPSSLCSISRSFQYYSLLNLDFDVVKGSGDRRSPSTMER